MVRNLKFVTGNPHKAREAMSILRELGVNVEVRILKVVEVQADDIVEIASFRAHRAYEVIREPLIVEDAGLFIEELKGFPGPYSSYVFKTIGNKGILKLMKDVSNRRAVFRSAVALHDGDRVTVFIGETWGVIAREARGDSWGFDPIFEPDEGGGLTYGEMTSDVKNRISHRRRALEKLASYILRTSSLNI
ncbi:MAG: non-canonical purine NTP pyrophosphatase, RdgB/HAM1 family [Thermoprotei archaeon]|nr:MAG: non-canonical purine NTP pyrophosphatase, RdgB/HAM1 family [Thermoprotei archaeon]